MNKRFSQTCGVCQCTFCWSDTMKVATEDPVTFEPLYDPVAGNLMECGPAGQAAFLPPHLLEPPACHVYGSIPEDLIVPDEVPWPLIFNAERYDTDNMHDNKEDASVIKFNTAGIYIVTANITWQENKKGDRAVFIRKNRATFIALESKHAGHEDLLVGHSVSVVQEFKVGEFVEVLVKQDSRKNLRVEANRYSPTFSAAFLRK